MGEFSHIVIMCKSAVIFAVRTQVLTTIMNFETQVLTTITNFGTQVLTAIMVIQDPGPDFKYGLSGPRS